MNFIDDIDLTNSVWLVGKKTSGKWYWADGTSWNYTNWGDGRPKDGNGYSRYNALVMSFNDRRWYDTRDYSTTTYTALCQCEFDPPMP